MCPNPSPKRQLDGYLSLPVQDAKVRCCESSVVDGEMDDTATATAPTTPALSPPEDSVMTDCLSSAREDDSSPPFTPSTGALLQYLSTHGLQRCTPVRLLGTGATCQVDLVHIPTAPDGPSSGLLSFSSLSSSSSAASLSSFSAPASSSFAEASSFSSSSSSCAPWICTAAAPFAAGAGCVPLVPHLVAARKVLPRSRDPHLRAREDAVFAREVEGLRAGLGCPFVVRLLGTAVHADRLELLMELAEGDTLEHELSDALSFVRGQPTQPLLPPARLAQVAASVLTALAALHRRGYAHLDIKPANLLLTAERRLLLGDGGCMQRAGPDGLLTAPASGTPLFAAPEVKRRGPYDLKADMYSVGVMLAVCAAWHRQTGRVLAWLRGDVGLPEYLPEGLRDLVGRLVVVDPAQRPTAEEALAHPFLAGVDVAELAPRRTCGCVPR